MILANGALFPPSEQTSILDSLEAKINETRAGALLSADTVIRAIDVLGQKAAEGAFEGLLAGFSIESLPQSFHSMLLLLKKEAVSYKVATELGDNFFTPYSTAPPLGQKTIAIRPMPLGTLLHIAAGNVDGLPAFSVIEGLLTGNVNILKLPQADNGFSLAVLEKLIEIEPSLAPFIYVFDTPSSDVAAVKKMARMADGIVVWGGEGAVSAVRALSPPGVKLIEWGHKLSFAYISGYTDKARELEMLAGHIISTKQLLCSSCQTIFLDTASMAGLYDFCEEFLPYLEAASEKAAFSIGETAEASLRRYTASLEKVLNPDSCAAERVFYGKRCSLKACTDSSLELSGLFGNCHVKKLPQDKIFSSLREQKHYLQTVGLICSPDKREALTDLFAKCGLVRITKAGAMSDTFCGEAHDGEYPLRRYTRIVNVE